MQTKPKKKKISTKKSNSDFYTDLPRFTSYNYLRNQRKKHQLDFELNVVLHFNFENNVCAVVNLGDNANCQFYRKAVNKRLQNGRLLVNDHFAIKQSSGLRLNKKANYLANQVKICTCDTRL
jgi:hypothetical protein